MFSAQEIYILRKENQYLKSHNTKLNQAYLNQKGKAEQSEEESKKLRQENRKLKEEIKKIRDELEKTKKQRDTYKGMIFKPKVIQTVTNTAEKKLGGQLGHVGISRTVPDKINKQIRVFLKHCPNCKSSLKRSNTFETHTIEDFPSLEILDSIVTQYKSERQWCGKCKKEVVGKFATVIPHSRLGLNLIIQILIFKYVCRMSLEIMVSTLFQTYGVKVTEGGIINILKRTKDWLGQAEYGKLLQAVRGSPIKHADETGWRINGINGWLWAFVTKHEVYYTIEETRGGGVARKVLEGSSRMDVLIRDDYSAYKNLPLIQQSYWAHLLRKSREEVTTKSCSKSMQALHLILKQMFQELEGITSEPFNLRKRQAAFQNYSLKVNQIIQAKFKAKDAKRIQVRIAHQGDKLLTALLHLNVPLTNNAAERIIRPAVVVRKISGGSRSNEGAETFAVNFSVIQTIRMRNQPLIPTLQTLLLNGALGNTE